MICGTKPNARSATCFCWQQTTQHTAMKMQQPRAGKTDLLGPLPELLQPARHFQGQGAARGCPPNVDGLVGEAPVLNQLHQRANHLQ